MLKFNEQSTTNSKNYREADALQQLLEAANAALNKQIELMEAADKDADYLEFTITVAGCQTAFYVGGPQICALHSFVLHIADENFYDVDIENAKVVSNQK